MLPHVILKLPESPLFYNYLPGGKFTRRSAAKRLQQEFIVNEKGWILDKSIGGNYQNI
jgi:hypothetical protein